MSLELLQTYRTLLRQARASVRFSKPATKNLRRLLRDEFRYLLSLPSLPLTCEGRTNTTSFFLSSSHSPRRFPLPSSALKTTLAHRVIYNLSSLTYHQLSPHTRMQSLKIRRVTAEVKPRSVTNMARIFSRIESDGLPHSNLVEDNVMINVTSDQIGMLRVHPKPVRGPIGSKLPYWDAQNPNKRQSSGITAGSGAAGQGGLPLAKADLEILQRTTDKLAATKEKLLQNALQTAVLQSQIRETEQQQESLQKRMSELKHKIKLFRKQEERKRKADQINGIPVKMLADVVGLAQCNENVWLGKRRWDIKRKGGWLTP